MPEIWNTILTLIVGGVLSQILAPIFVARFGKTKRERNIDLAERMSQISDKTAKQLFEKLQQVDTLEDEIRELQSRRAERDKQIEDLQQANAELLEREEARSIELDRLREQIAKESQAARELREKYESLKQFTRSLIAALEKRGIDLPELNGGLPDSILGYKWPKAGDE